MTVARSAGGGRREAATSGRSGGGDGPPLDARGIADERLTARIVAKSSGENFPVASRLLPAGVRRDLLAVYAYARLVDDLGDEAPGDRNLLLDRVEADLLAVAGDDGDPPAPHAATGPGGRPVLPVVRDLAVTMRRHRIPAGPFLALVEANRRDQTVHRYRTYAELLDYCTLSANPVGQVVLHLFDAATPERVALSDRICTALQIAEHLQDVAEDHGRGRVYLPEEDLRRFGCTEGDLALGVAPVRVRRLVAFQRRRARALLDSGTPLVRTLPGLARLAVAGYVAGGRAALAAVEAAGDDVLRATPRPARRHLAAQWLLVLLAGGGAA